MKRLSILGVSGSIGKSTLKVLDNHLNEFKLVAVSVNSSLDLLYQIIDKYHPEYAVCADESYFGEHFTDEFMVYNGVTIYAGFAGIEKICKDPRNDIILNAISGKAGVLPSMIAVEHCKELALANKESIVCAGRLLINKAIESGSRIIPVDSEHSAIFALLRTLEKKNLEKIHITASGGPFLTLPKEKWGEVTVDDALKHPTWSMGRKISIDSATMANKGLEVIEAHFLFKVPYEKINVLIHPQSLVHSMVETIDGEIYAQLGPNDMSIPIQNALTYPKMGQNSYSRFDFTTGVSLEFQPMDYSKFPMLKYAFECGRLGGVYPAFYNYVNEQLVSIFLDGKIKFLDIEIFMGKAIDSFKTHPYGQESLESIKQLPVIEQISEQIVVQLMGEQ